MYHISRGEIIEKKVQIQNYELKHKKCLLLYQSDGTEMENEQPDSSGVDR